MKLSARPSEDNAEIIANGAHIKPGKKLDWLLHDDILRKRVSANERNKTQLK